MGIDDGTAQCEQEAHSNNSNALQRMEALPIEASWDLLPCARKDLYQQLSCCQQNRRIE